MLGLKEPPGWSLDPSSNFASLGMLVFRLLLPIVYGEKAEFSLKVLENVTVQENLCVQIPCTFSYGRKNASQGQIFLFWHLDGKNKTVATNKPNVTIPAKFQGRFSIIGNPQNYNCSLFIMNAQKTDKGKYSLKVKKGKLIHDFGNKVSVKVLEMTQKPEIQIPETLDSGHPVTLTCKMPGACEGENSPTFLWTGSALSSLSPGTRTHASSELTFTPRPQDHGTNLTCQVTFKEPYVSSEETVQLRVTYPPKEITIQVFHGNWTGAPGNALYLPILEGESLSLSCAADSNPATSLKWTKGRQTLNSSQPSSAGVVALQLHQVGPRDSGEYICQTQDPLGSQKASLMLSVQYPPKLLSSSCSWTEEGLLCNCSVQAEPAPSLLWWLGEKIMQGNNSDTLWKVSTTSGVWINSSLNLKEKLDPALSLRCEGRNRHGTHSLSILLLPDRTSPDTELNMKPLIMGAACGACVTGLLALGVIIVVKTLKKKSAEMRTNTSRAEANVGDRHPSSEAIPLDPNRMLRSSPCDTVKSTSEEEPQLHYACLNFQRLRPQEPQESAYTGTEYAELKFQKQPL
ncbi:sialic acid-binding Ig-like lectin 14 [Monodelphis domestica]|uniref:sialic acid-binding Ig-like lectin 14 n=1 Tax=Monodelphis domestica TaxID=13616 RepID=UPI0024E20CF9|nr:sialic acid-binding Ig-like lectin 14 [Monodelphis domestica]